MRIIEHNHCDCELYSEEVKKRVTNVLRYAKQIAELQTLLVDIKEEAKNLSEFFLTKKEQEERTELVNFFDARMQAMAFYTIKNMEKYQAFGWKELFYRGDNENDGTK